MHLFATSAMDAMKQISPAVWFKIAVGIGLVVLTVFLLRKVFSMNKMIMGVVIFVAGSIIFFSWIYNRNEPKFMTPLVDRLALFFPTAGAYENKQQTLPKR